MSADDVAEFFAEQDERMAISDEPVEEYLSRIAAYRKSQFTEEDTGIKQYLTPIQLRPPQGTVIDPQVQMHSSVKRKTTPFPDSNPRKKVKNLQINDQTSSLSGDPTNNVLRENVKRINGELSVVRQAENPALSAEEQLIARSFSKSLDTETLNSAFIVVSPSASIKSTRLATNASALPVDSSSEQRRHAISNDIPSRIRSHAQSQIVSHTHSIPSFGSPLPNETSDAFPNLEINFQPQAVSTQARYIDGDLHANQLVASKVSSHSASKRKDKVIRITPGKRGGKLPTRSTVSGNTPDSVIEAISDTSSSHAFSLIAEPEPTPVSSVPNEKSKVSRQKSSSAPVDSVSSSIPDPSSSCTAVMPTKEQKVDGKFGKKTRNQEVKKTKGKGKEKPALVTPLEYAQRLQDKIRISMIPEKISKYLKGKKVFYIGGDMQYAGDRTRGRMDFIVKHGGTLQPTYDPTTVTHIVTDAPRRPTLRALGLKKLGEIPDHVPTVNWNWVISGLGRAPIRPVGKSKEEEDEGVQMDDVFMHAAFVERLDAGVEHVRPKTLAKGKINTPSYLDKGKGKAAAADEPGRDDEFSRISQFTQDKPSQQLLPLARPGFKVRGSSEGDSKQHGYEPPSTVYPEENNAYGAAARSADVLAEFYEQARAEREIVAGRTDGEESDVGGESCDEVDDAPIKPVKRGFTCDTKEVQHSNCVNQDVVDKLQALMKLHKAKPSDEDHWRAFSYGRCLRALRNYPIRIKSYSEARSIRGVGDKTALKIMEILQTGDLRRINYENTEDVSVTHTFQGIYGVGQSTAFKWYVSGCRTLEDVKARKGGIKLSTAQEIGLRFYDDINDRMPRSEAEAIFDVIRPVALKLDSKLLIDIMGSFRRGKADCGDIDILITRPTDDGKTHAGLIANLLQELHAVGILTEDLSIPEDLNDLETCYRGLCCLPVEGSRRRRIDILTVPQKSRGAALLYYTGDDIFNRAMRLKANVLGFSLNQKGLYDGVVRDPLDRRVKMNAGTIIASETEEEIFKILGVPWQEPFERVRG